MTVMRAAGRAPRTITVHRSYLSRLAARHSDPWLVTPGELLAFMAEHRWAPETRRSARMVLRGFYRWAHGMGHIEDDPALVLPTVTVPVRVASPTPEFVYRQALRLADRRLELLLRLGTHGLRCMELAQVHASDWDRDRRILVVTGKGGRVRNVPIRDTDLVAHLDALVGWAFPNQWTGRPITAGYVSKLLSEGLAVHWTGHSLRHRCGTTGYRATRDLIAVGKMLGHARLSTTQIYVLSDDEDMIPIADALAS